MIDNLNAKYKEKQTAYNVERMTRQIRKDVEIFIAYSPPKMTDEFDGLLVKDVDELLENLEVKSGRDHASTFVPLFACTVRYRLKNCKFSIDDIHFSKIG